MLRLYVQARPRATSILHKAAGIGGASYIGLSLSSAPIRIESKSNSTMAAQDMNEQGGEQRGQQAMLASQRAKEQGQEQGRIAKWFPLSASEGFSQWWAGHSPMATEHRVLSFIPHLQKPPTHTQTGSAPATAAPSSADLTAPPQNPEAHTTTDSLTDPYGPRRWNSQMVG
jgi:cardiolipin-specific phospholipase